MLRQPSHLFSESGDGLKTFFLRLLEAPVRMAEAMAVGFEARGRVEDSMVEPWVVEVEGRSGSSASLLHFLFLHKNGLTLKQITGRSSQQFL